MTRTTHRSTRHQYHVTWDSKRRLWVAKVGGAIFGFRCVRDDLIDHLTLMLDFCANERMQRSEIVIHRKDGRIGTGSGSRRTHGADPRRHRG